MVLISYDCMVLQGEVKNGRKLYTFFPFFLRLTLILSSQLLKTFPELRKVYLVFRTRTRFTNLSLP